MDLVADRINHAMDKIPTTWAIFGLAFLYLIYWNVHTLYFHPLARFPGPKSWIISRIPFFFALRAGTYMQRITTLHAKYGPIIRIGVNELSFTDGRAWEEIYAMKAGMEKNPNWCPAPKNGVRGILTANKADHARYRHLLAPVFSEKALREQEPIIQKYISLMISKLKEEEIKAPSKPVDLVKWTEYTVFDLMGELSLGESFHSLDNADHRPFVAGFIKNLQAVMYIISSNYLPEVRAVLLWLVPKKVWINHIKHSEYVGHQVRARLAEGDNPHKPDFITWLCRFSNTDNVGMSIPEIESNVGTILIAGSETTATSITGIIFELLKHPESFAELAREIREKFRYECDINSQSTQKLTFLNAVIEEGLRYCAPAPAFGSRVVPNQGAQICSEWIPGGTFVCVAQYPCFHSPLNFSEPNAFKPARFLDPASMAVHNTKALNPFSMGNRNCIGKKQAYVEMRLILARLIWNFDMEGTDLKWHWADQKTFLLWEKKPVMVKLTSIKR